MTGTWHALRQGHMKKWARSVRSPTFALTIAAVGLVACGGGGGGAVPIDNDPTSSSEEAGENIVIKTSVNLVHTPKEEVRVGQFVSSGEVLAGSVIGGSPFCSGGTFRDVHGPPEVGLVDRTLRCPDGRLRIGFTPGVPQGRTQAGPWTVIGGTGAFDQMQGSGQMDVKYSPGTGTTRGHETFTGTVVP